MTTPQPPADDAATEPVPQQQADGPAPTLPRPSRGVVLALLAAFLLGGLVCGGFGLAAGVMIGHRAGHHQVGFDRDHRDDARERKERLREQPWLQKDRGLRDHQPQDLRDQKLRDLRDQELKRRLMERMRLRGLDGMLPACPPVPPMPAPGLPAPSPAG